MLIFDKQYLFWTIWSILGFCRKSISAGQLFALTLFLGAFKKWLKAIKLNKNWAWGFIMNDARLKSPVDFSVVYISLAPSMSRRRFLAIWLSQWTAKTRSELPTGNLTNGQVFFDSWPSQAADTLLSPSYIGNTLGPPHWNFRTALDESSDFTM